LGPDPPVRKIARIQKVDVASRLVGGADKMAGEGVEPE
jgi:hypothetical protein